MKYIVLSALLYGCQGAPTQISSPMSTQKLYTPPVPDVSTPSPNPDAQVSPKKGPDFHQQIMGACLAYADFLAQGCTPQINQMLEDQCKTAQTDFCTYAQQEHNSNYCAAIPPFSGAVCYYKINECLQTNPNFTQCSTQILQELTQSHKSPQGPSQ